MNDLLIGVDVGGTTTKIGIITDKGNILEKWEIATRTENNGAAIVDDIWTSIANKMETLKWNTDRLLGIGIGAPGFADVASGVIFEAVNIGWQKYNLKDHLMNVSGLTVFVENDANIAALGENWMGAGNQAENLIAITLGTGVGGGIIVNGNILNGENGTAGEIGHITVELDGSPCNCGKSGCLETVASATGIVRQAMAIVRGNPAGSLADFYERTGTITAKDVFVLAQEGNPDCKQIIRYTGKVLGLAIANIATVINPAKILIGGGVSKAGDQLLSIIKETFHTYALPRVSEVMDMKIAQLGNDAGIIGAAFLVKQHMHTDGL